MKLRIINEFDWNTATNVAAGLGGAAALGYYGYKGLQMYNRYKINKLENELKDDLTNDTELNELVEELNKTKELNDEQKLKLYSEIKSIKNFLMKNPHLYKPELYKNQIKQLILTSAPITASQFNDKQAEKEKIANEERAKERKEKENNSFDYKINELFNLINDKIVLKNGKLNVFVYKDNYINAFCVPGQNASKLIIEANKYTFLKRLLEKVPLFNIYFNFIDQFKQFRKNMLGRALYNSATGKITLTYDFSENLIGISDGAIKKFTPEQSFALILHEIGHLIYTGYQCLGTAINAINDTISCFNLGKIGMDFYNQTIKKNESTFSIFNNNIITGIQLFLTMIGFPEFIKKYLDNKNEAIADDFVIKCGYGNQLYEIMSILKNENQQKLNKINELILLKKKINNNEGIPIYNLEKFKSNNLQGDHNQDYDLRRHDIKQKINGYIPATPNIPDDDEDINDIKLQPNNTI